MLTFYIVFNLNLIELELFPIQRVALLNVKYSKSFPPKEWCSKSFVSRNIGENFGGVSLIGNSVSKRYIQTSNEGV